MKKIFIILLSVIFLEVLSISGLCAENLGVQITKKDCQLLPRHIGSADVKFKPGFDVHGHKVLPADIQDLNTLNLPNVLEFNIDIDIRKYLGGPEDNALAASAAVIAANKATTAVTSSKTAVTLAEAAATIAETISNTANVIAATAATNVTSAKIALDNNPLDKTLRDSWEATKLISDSTSASATIAYSNAAAIAAIASKARLAADTANTSTLAGDKASYSKIAAIEVMAAATLAAAAAGNDSSKTSLANAANEASIAAITAASDASNSSSANTKLIAANRQTKKLTGLNMNVGKIHYNIKTGNLYFNGQALTNTERNTLDKICQRLLNRGH